jgi:3-deoxy-D-arabino-heptulosonate 7-phosphate (DAHP) synthase
MVEVHNRPELALSDGAQALTPAEYARLIREVRAIREVTVTVREDGQAPSENA